MAKKQGILLCNLGTPEAASKFAVKKFLSQFLHDKRVVSIPRIIWCPILHGIILRTRPVKVAKLYQSIWLKEGSPLLVYSQQQQSKLQSLVDESFSEQQQTKHIPIELAMSYGNPSISNGLKSLENQGCERIIIFPLYPQYSSATNAPVYDQVHKYYKNRYFIPELSFVNGYHDHPLYIKSLAESIKLHWQKHGQAQQLLFSYHGVPQRFSDKGDPYEVQCRQTTDLVVKELGLSENQYKIAFQSRFGKEKWVEPYTEMVLQEWPAKGVNKVQVVSPAFSVDCLETLEELAVQNKELFIAAGGKGYQYIPALNAETNHIQMMASVIKQHLHTTESINTGPTS